MPDEIEKSSPPTETTVVSRFERVRTWLPAVAFVGGFLWDAITLGRTIKSWDLLLLFGYWIASAVLIVLIGRDVKWRFAEWMNWALQFLFGGIFSALVIFYFLSSSDLPGLLLVLGLVVLLVGNEFLESRYSRMMLSWTFFAFAGIMLLNFALPHMFRSISQVWFYVSTIFAVALVVGLRYLTRQRFVYVIPSFVVATLLVVLFALNVIPPVPLVKKQMLLAHDLIRSDGSYVMTVERPRPWQFWIASSRVWHRRDAEPIYCFTSVWVPPGIETTIHHRWERFDRQSKRWLFEGDVPFVIRGGREGGYRGYTFKGEVQPGEWRVMALSDHGDTIGILRFAVEPAEDRLNVRKLVF
ncbi:MAG: DUF2914 domain-containing protein [Thermoanaerobaculia bacterium]